MSYHYYVQLIAKNCQLISNIKLFLKYIMGIILENIAIDFLFNLCVCMYKFEPCVHKWNWIRILFLDCLFQVHKVMFIPQAL